MVQVDLFNLITLYSRNYSFFDNYDVSVSFNEEALDKIFESPIEIIEDFFLHLSNDERTQIIDYFIRYSVKNKIRSNIQREILKLTSKKVFEENIDSILELKNPISKKDLEEWEKKVDNKEVKLKLKQKRNNSARINNKS